MKGILKRIRAVERGSGESRAEGGKDTEQGMISAFKPGLRVKEKLQC